MQTSTIIQAALSTTLTVFYAQAGAGTVPFELPSQSPITIHEAGQRFLEENPTSVNGTLSSFATHSPLVKWTRVEGTMEPSDRVQAGDQQARVSLTPSEYETIEELTERIERLASFGDGWKGPGSLRATESAKRDAITLARKLVACIPGAPRPSVGLDGDGVFCLSWRDADLSGNFSVYGDGTYSFFAKRAGRPSFGDAEMIAGPIPAALSVIFAS